MGNRKPVSTVLKERENAKKNGQYKRSIYSQRPTAETVVKQREKDINAGKYESDYYTGKRESSTYKAPIHHYNSADLERKTPTWQEYKKSQKPQAATKSSVEKKTFVTETEAVEELKKLGISDREIKRMQLTKTVNSDWSSDLEMARKAKQAESERKAGTYTTPAYQKYLDEIRGSVEKLKNDNQDGKNDFEIAKRNEWLEGQRYDIKSLNDEETLQEVKRYTELKNSGTVVGRTSYEAKGLESPQAREYDATVERLRQKGYSDEQIEHLSDTYTRIENAKDKQKRDAQMRSWKDAKILHNLLSVGSNMLGGAGALEGISRAVQETVTGKYSPVDTNAPVFYPGDYTNMVRQGTEKAIEDKIRGKTGKGLGMLYSGASATADSLAQLAVLGPGWSLANMSAGAASNSIKSTFERTGDTEKSAITGMAAGAIEAATEKIGLDNLWDIAKGSGKAAARNAMANIMIQSGIEGSEELAADFGNLVVDNVVNGGMSEYQMNVRNYMSNGYGEEEAKKQARKDFALQCAESLAVGAISGGIGSGIGTGAQSIQTGLIGSEAKNTGTIEETVKRAEELNDYHVQKALNQYQQNPSAYKAGKLMGEVARAEEQGIKQSERVPNNAEYYMNKIQTAETAEDMAEAMREVEKNGTKEEIKIARMKYEYRTGKLLSTGKITQEELGTAKNQITQEEAYKLGRNGEVVDATRLSEKGRQAYEKGTKQYQIEKETLTQEDIKEANHAAAVGADGKKFVVTGIEETGTNPVVSTKSGSVKLSDVTFQNEKVQMLYNNASTQKTTDAAKVYVECYPTGVTVTSYDRQFDRFLTAGRMGVPFTNLTRKSSFMTQMIGTEALKKIYDAGKNMEQEIEKAKENSKVRQKGQGKVIDKRSDKTEHPMMEVYEKLAKKTGQNIILKDSDMEGINGYFQKSMSEIVLNVNSDQQYATLFHEALGEFSEAWNDEGMKLFQNDLLEWYLDQYGESAGKVIENYKEVYQKAEGSKSYREAANEMVNDALVGLFRSEKGIEDFADWLSENKTQAETKTVLQKIADFIKEICDKIKTFIQTEHLSNTAKAAMQMEADKAAELRKRLLEIADRAIENYQNTEVGNMVDDVKFSLTGVDENGIEIYETSEETKKLSFKQRREEMLRLMKEEYRGRTAKFNKNGKTYYARYNEAGVKKGIYGDKKSDKKGWGAKLNIGADGNYIELAENALYSGSKEEIGKENAFHKNAQSWDYYVKTVKSDGKYFDVLINVKDTGSEQFVYDITLKEATDSHALKHFKVSRTASESSISQNKENTTDDTKFSLKVDIDAELKQYGVENKLNDYIGVQKGVIGKLREEGYFLDNGIENKETGMKVKITPRGIKETLGTGKRFQTLPRDLKRLKIATIHSLPEIIEKASLLEDDVENIHGENSKYAYFYTDINLNGEKLGVKIDIRKTTATNKFWIHNVEIKKSSSLLQPAITQALNENQNSKQTITSEQGSVNDNLRYSLSDTTDLGLFWESYDDFNSTIASSASIIEQGAKALQGKEVDKNLVRQIAGNMKSEYGSKIDLNTFTDNLTKVFAYMQTQEKADYEDMLRVMTEVAMPVIEESTSYDPVELQQYKDFKKQVRDTKIRLSDAQKQEAEYYYDSYENFRKRNFGTLTLSDGGTYLESVWQELVNASGGFLESDVNPANMPTVLIEAIDQMKPQLHNNFGADNHGVAMDLSLRIYEEYFKSQAAGNTKALKAKMVHERAVFHEKLRKEYAEKLKAERIRMRERQGKIDDKVAKVRAAQKNKELRQKQEQKLKKHRESVKKNGETLMKWIENPTNQKHIPKKLEKLTMEFLSAIDFISHRAQEDSYTTKRWQELMKNVALKLKMAEDSELDTGYENFLSALDADFLGDLNEFLKNNDSVVKLSEIGVERLPEMETLDKLMQRMKTAVTKTNELDANKQFKTVQEVSNKTIRELQKKKDQKARNKLLKTIGNILNIDMIDPLSYFKMMGPAAESMYQELREGFNTRTWHLKEAKEYMDEALKDIKKKDLKKWTGENAELHTFKVETTGEKRELRLTTGQIMNLYLLGKRPQAKPHIMSGGIKAEEAGKGKKRFVQHKAIHITPQLYGEIVDKLTDEQRELADKMQSFLAKNCAEWGNNTTMKLYGYNKFTEEMYWPIKTDDNTNLTNDKTTNDASLYAIRNFSATKNVVKDAKNGVIIGDIMDVFAKHVSDMANYDGFAVPLTDCMKWYNYKNQEEVNGFLEADMVKEEIQRVYGAKAKRYFVTLIKEINGEITRDTAENPGGKFISNYKAAAVGANLRVAIQQVTAIARAAMVLNPVDITAALTKGPKVKKAMENSAIALWKSWGFFETDIGRSVETVITGQETFVEKIREKSMLLAELGDNITWGYLWTACENEVKRKNKGLKKDSEEFVEKVRKRFDQVIDETQVVDTVLHKSQLMRSKNALIKMEMSFMNEPQKTYNMLWRAAHEGKLQFGKATIVFAATGMLTAAAASVMDAVRDDNEEQDFLEKYLEALFGGEMDDNEKWYEKVKGIVGSNTFSSLNPLGMTPYLKQIFSLMEGFDTGRMDLAALASLRKTIEDTLKDKKNKYGDAKAYVRVMSQFTGIPAYNLLREVESFCETISGKKWSEYNKK